MTDSLAMAIVPFDRAELLDRIAGDEGLAGELVAAYQDEAPGLVERVGRALDAMDARAVEYAAHSLKGLLLNVSAGRAARIAKRIEAAGRAGDLGAALYWFESLGPELERAGRAMI